MAIACADPHPQRAGEGARGEQRRVFRPQAVELARRLDHVALVTPTRALPAADHHSGAPFNPSEGQRQPADRRRSPALDQIEREFTLTLHRNADRGDRDQLIAGPLARLQFADLHWLAATQTAHVVGREQIAEQAIVHRTVSRAMVAADEARAQRVETIGDSNPRRTNRPSPCRETAWERNLRARQSSN